MYLNKLFSSLAVNFAICYAISIEFNSKFMVGVEFARMTDYPIRSRSRVGVVQVNRVQYRSVWGSEQVVAAFKTGRG